MRKILQTIALAVLCLNFSSNAQTTTTNIRPLNIGDKVPDELWNLPLQVVNHPEGKDTITLSDYKGKLIILDFWATWCSACIKNFPKMERLQNDFKDKIQVVLVAFDDSTKASDFFIKREKNEGKEYELPSVVKDSVLTAMFPHRLIPHYVWITADGIVKATTSAWEVTDDNIKQMLDDVQIMDMKIDMDLEKPLYSADYLPLEKLQHYSILIKGYIEGTGSGTRPRRLNLQTVGGIFTNHPILSLYEICFRALDGTYDIKRLSTSIAKPEMFFQNKSKIPMQDWYKLNAYSLDFIVPINKADSLYEYMLEDLNRYSPYYGKVGKREERCLVLSQSGSTSDFSYKAGEQQNKVEDGLLKLNNVPIHYLIAHLNEEFSFGLLAIDETQYKGKVGINFSSPVDNLFDLKRELAKHGLQLKEEKRMISQFRISDKPSTL